MLLLLLNVCLQLGVPSVMYVGLYRGEASNIICVNNVMLFVKYIIIIVCRLAGLDLLLLIMFAYNTVYI